jgi:hypothetical protein
MITGIETEYGIVAHPSPGEPGLGPQEASLLLLGAWERGVPSAGCTAGPVDDLMLHNGARYYLDHMHPEYSTAETRHPRAVVAADRAGERILDACREHLERRSAGEEGGARLSLFKNNSDQKGNSYGCHENYLLSPAAWESVTERGGAGLATFVPFLVTRVLLAGAGKVGAENGTPPAGFQLSQRADFFETLYGVQTTHHRPLVNLRNEPHAPPHRWRRLHVIAGDANRAELSTFLKVGATQLVLEMIEVGAAPEGLALADPLGAFREVSRDLSFRRPLALADGTGRTALELQRAYLAHARAFLGTRPDFAPYGEVVELWDEVLQCLEGDWTELSGMLDWAVKRALLEEVLARSGASWAQVEAWQPVIEATLALPPGCLPDRGAPAPPDPARLGGHPAAAALAGAGVDWGDYWAQRALYFRLRRLDLEYHDIRREAADPGLFARLEEAGAVERLVSDDEVRALVERPPRDTRAWLRGRLLERLGPQVAAADWSYLLVGPGAAGEHLRIDLSDPDWGSADDCEAWLPAVDSPEAAGAALPERAAAGAAPLSPIPGEVA